MSSTATSPLFVYFDGDDVGARIELLLVRGDTAGSGDLSRSVSGAIAALAHELSTRYAASVIFAAGDEVLAELPTRVQLDVLDDLRSEFRERTGGTISCGAGVSSIEANRNLRIAKLMGKDTTYGGPR